MTFYSRKSNRLKDYNYNSAGYYFITICTFNKEKFFGEVIKDDVKLSNIGEIAKNCWLEIPIYFKGVILDIFVVMPNHIHGIILIPDTVSNMGLSNIIGSFKSSVTRLVRGKGHCFSWQRSFYDHVIRNDKTLSSIREYMQNNPHKWSIDIENKLAHINGNDYYSKLIE